MHNLTLVHLDSRVIASFCYARYALEEYIVWPILRAIIGYFLKDYNTAIRQNVTRKTEKKFCSILRGLRYD